MTCRELAVKLAQCSNTVRFKYRDQDLADKILELANKVWDLGEPLPSAGSGSKS